MDTIRAHFFDAIFGDGYMLVFDNFMQALCKIDIKTFEMSIISYYKGEKNFIARKIFLFQNKIYLASNNSAEILIYDVKMDNKGLAFSLFSFLLDKEVRYTVFEHNNIIYFFPLCLSEKIICFNLIENNFYKKNFFDVSLLKETHNCNTMGFSYIFDDFLWFVIYGTKYYVRYNLINENVDIFESLDSKMTLRAVCFDGKKIWLTNTHNNDICCGEERVIKISGKGSYSWMYDIGEYILALPGRDDKVILIHKNTFEEIQIDLQSSKGMKEQSRRGSGMICCKKYRDYVFLFPYRIRDLFVLNIRSLIIQKVGLKCDNYIEKFFEINKKLIYETENIKLRGLLFLKKKTGFKCIEKGNRGDNIWKIAKQ